MLRGVGCVRDEIEEKKKLKFYGNKMMMWQEMQGIPHGSLSENKFPFLLHSSYTRAVCSQTVAQYFCCFCLFHLDVNV